MKPSCWICLVLLAANSVSALDVRQVNWGFDGKVVPNRFSLLSVLVANDSDVPFDGTLNLYKNQDVEGRVGAVYQTTCYVSPMTTRWVQFYVYIENQNNVWRLEWGRAPNDCLDLKDEYKPKWGPLAQVLLSDSESMVSIVSAFRQFPEELFPATAAATGGLDSVLLDHAPRWEPAQRLAFLNWLRAGGKVHLLRDADGHYPVFTDELQVLNLSMERARVGAGLVVRHAATTRDIRKQDIEVGEVPLRELKPEDQVTAQTSESFFRDLAQLSRRRYEWGWLYLLALTYVALVGPGNLMAGRKLGDYRLRIALLLVTVAGFAWLFNLVGRRGQGETSLVHTLSCARSIEGDTYDVMQWINVFTTHGADYTITHAAPDNLYASGQDYEPVKGWIESGKAGRFVVDIPLFSRRALMHEAEMKGANIPVKILGWDGTGGLRKLTLNAGPEFTKQILEGWVVQGDQLYAMKLKEGSLEFGTSGQQPLSSFLSASGPQYFGPGYGPYYGRPYEKQDVDVDGQFRKMAKALIGWSLDTEDLDHAPASATDNRVELFLFARSPQGFAVSGSQFGREVGYVLYRFDLFKPGS